MLFWSGQLARDPDSSVPVCVSYQCTTYSLYIYIMRYTIRILVTFGRDEGGNVIFSIKIGGGGPNLISFVQSLLASRFNLLLANIGASENM